MQKKYKKALAFAVSLSLSAAVLSACGDSRQADQTNTTDYTSASKEPKAMGRYLEEELPLPEEVHNVTSFKILDSGIMRLVYTDSDYQYHIADSKDQGHTWEEKESPSKIFGLNPEDTYISNISLSSDGAVFAAACNTVESNKDSGIFLYYLSADGVPTQLTLENSRETAYITTRYVYQSCFTPGNTILINDYSNGIAEIDPNNNSLLTRYETGECVETFGTAGNYLISIQNQTVHYYDLTTGDPVDTADTLTEQLSKNPENLVMTSTSSFPVFFTDGDIDHSLFYIDKNGICRYVMEGSTVEQIVNGNLNTISSPDAGFVDFTRDQKGSFYLAANLYDSSVTTPKVFRYVYSADIPSVPDTELTVYTLTENRFIQQAAIIFQKENPDVYVNVETGMSGDDSVTGMDAVKILNTEIMAGKGPDLLILDGLPAETYREKGLLEDISGLLKDTKLLDNIRAAYTEEDGSIYSMPVKFAIPFIQGKKEIIDELKNNPYPLKVLADAAERQKDTYDLRHYFDLLATSPQLLIKAYSNVCMPAWIKEDGTLDETTISQYLEQTKRIYQSQKDAVESTEQHYDQSYASVADQYTRESFKSSSFAMNLLSGSCIIGTGGMFSSSDLAWLDSLENVNDTITSTLWNGQSQNIFFPECLAGISAKAKEKEAAEQFIRFIFSEEGQKSGSDNGFSVNSTVYENIVNWKQGENETLSFAGSSDNETGESINLEIKQASDDKIREIMELGKTLTVPSETNEIVLNAVIESGARYFRDEITLDEAVKGAVQEVNLYLSE